MGDPGSDTVAELLRRIAAGDRLAHDHLFSLVENELRHIAAARMRNQPKGHTLQVTALVNETYLRLCRVDPNDWRGRKHFFSFAARAMRHILADHARNRGRRKRRATGDRIEFDELLDEYSERAIDPLALDAALTELEKLDPMLSEIVHHRFFNGLSMEEISELEGMPLRTLERRWKTARAWLRRELSQ